MQYSLSITYVGFFFFIYLIIDLIFGVGFKLNFLVFMFSERSNKHKL